MNIGKLYEGQIISNYRKLCELLNWEIKSGNTKIAQMNELSRYCDWIKEGNKIVITNIFNNPKENIIHKEGRYSGNWIEYNQFKIDYEKRNNIGVYCIVKDNDIYVGSTINGFRQRFKEHYHGYDELMQHTYEMLQDGGEFHVLYDMTGIEDEVLVRKVENEYIQYFKNSTNYNVINKKEKAYSITEKIKLKNKIIRVSEDKYNQAIQLLIENGLIEDEELNETSDNYILNGMINDFDIGNVPF